MSRRFASCLVVVVAALLLVATDTHASPLRVGSKRFTESYLLAEVISALARREGMAVVHEQGLGGTAVTYRALESGSIDVYPEYSGTIAETVLGEGRVGLPRIREALAPKGIGVSDPIGFRNTYALATTRATAARLGLQRMSDLAAHGGLRFGLSHEFAGRVDGWKGVAATYALTERTPSTVDHALAYDALVDGKIDITDVYTTDAKVARFDLVVLDDDRRFFPPYEAILLYRLDALTRLPAFARVLGQMRGSIDEVSMRSMNARAELDGVSIARVAAEHVGDDVSRAPSKISFLGGVLQVIERHGPRHLALVLGSLFLSTMIGVPLGVLAAGRRRTGALVLGIAGIVQTIPSLALFCFLIPVLGIGWLPAVVALFLYGLLPIVRNTHAGLTSIPVELREAAHALGLSGRERMRYIELPLASRTLLAGIKTSAVVAVGSATIAAFIGAGGFGEPISTGLALNDVRTILQGALPAAGLALLIQSLFALLEGALVPRGLRLDRDS